MKGIGYDSNEISDCMVIHKVGNDHREYTSNFTSKDKFIYNYLLVAL